MEFGICRARRFDGVYERLVDCPIFDCHTEEVEDPFIWKDAEGYRMMAKDMRGVICGERQAGVYAGSQDGIHWDFCKKGPFYSRKILWDDGVVREMGNLERPFLLIENGVPTHAFFATGEGENEAGFSKLKRTWNMVIPLKWQ